MLDLKHTIYYFCKNLYGNLKYIFMKALKIGVYVAAAIAFFLVFNSLAYVAYESQHLKYHIVLGKIFLAGCLLFSCVFLPLYIIYRFRQKEIKDKSV